MAARGSSRQKSPRKKATPAAGPAPSAQREPLKFDGLPGLPRKRLEGRRRKPGRTVDPDTGETTVISAVIYFEQPLSKKTHEAVRSSMDHKQRLSEDLDYRLAGLTPDELAARVERHRARRERCGEAQLPKIADEAAELRKALESWLLSLRPEHAKEVRQAYQEVAKRRLSWSRTPKGLDKLIVSAFRLGHWVAQADALHPTKPWTAVRAASDRRREKSKAGQGRGKQIAKEAARNDQQITQLHRRWQTSDELQDLFRSSVPYIQQKTGLSGRTIQRRLNVLSSQKATKTRQ